MIEKRKLFTQFTVLERGQVQLRETTRILESGSVISENHHRFVREPGDDITDLPSNYSSSIAIFWTPEVIQDWEVYVSQS